MIFYDCSTAPSPKRARMFIAEKGLEIETREVSIAKGEQLAPEFVAINPFATVPVLVTDDGTTLTENNGIAAYLEAAFPEPPLMGTTPEERGLVIQWNAICEQHGGAPIAEALRNGNPHMVGRALTGQKNTEQIPALVDRGLARIDDFYTLLENRLSESQWVALDSFSMADITAFVFVSFTRVVKKSIPEDNTATLDWFGRMKSRPSASL
ncbi:MAG: glutathione S-transferase family protein [Paracoccaceae bacterium]